MRDGNKYHDTKTDTLHIKDVEKSDKGSYQCLVKNDAGEVLSEEADLAVSMLVIKLILLIIESFEFSFLFATKPTSEDTSCILVLF